MGKSNNARRERASLRAHYEKKAAGRTAGLKASLAETSALCGQLRQENAMLRRKTEADAETIRKQDMLISQLQSRLDLSDAQMDQFRASLDTAHEAAAAARASKLVLDEIQRMFGTALGTGPAYGIPGTLPAGLPDDGPLSGRGGA